MSGNILLSFTLLHDDLLIQYPFPYLLFLLFIVIVLIFLFINVLRSLVALSKRIEVPKRGKTIRMPSLFSISYPIFLIKKIILKIEQFFISEDLFLIMFFISIFFLLSKTEIHAQQSNTIDYPMSSGNILPDHPLYKMKVVQDKIRYRLLINHVKKIEFNLLLADEGIQASKELIDKGKISLAKETVLKGEHNYSKLVSDYALAVFHDENIPEVLDKKIDMAALKHQEVFNNIKQQVSDQEKKTFDDVIYFSKKNIEVLQAIRKQNLDKR